MIFSVLNMAVQVVPASSEWSWYSISGPIILKSGKWDSQGADFEDYRVASFDAV
jgi:hypothetical protein